MLPSQALALPLTDRRDTEAATWTVSQAVQREEPSRPHLTRSLAPPEAVQLGILKTIHYSY